MGGDLKCFFCNKKGHLKKDCLKRKNWFENKGKISNISLVICETNLINVLFYTWWIN